MGVEGIQQKQSDAGSIVHCVMPACISRPSARTFDECVTARIPARILVIGDAGR